MLQSKLLDAYRKDYETIGSFWVLRLYQVAPCCYVVQVVHTTLNEDGKLKSRRVSQYGYSSYIEALDHFEKHRK